MEKVALGRGEVPREQACPPSPFPFLPLTGTKLRPDLERELGQFEEGCGQRWPELQALAEATLSWGGTAVPQDHAGILGALGVHPEQPSITLQPPQQRVQHTAPSPRKGSHSGPLLV